jgi:hypothetical protein
MIMEDVQEKYIELHGSLPWIFSASTPLWDLEYADDTVLLGRSSEVVQNFLDILVTVAKSHGLELNHDKCEHLAIHSDNSIYFNDESFSALIPKVDFVKYLGVLLCPNADSGREVSRRLNQARAAFKLLSPFFKNRSLTLKWKITVYQQILSSILVYAMESLSLTPAHLRRLDSFFFKVVRSALGKKSSFYHKVLNPTDTECSNSSLIASLWRKDIKILPPSQVIYQRQLQMLGHFLRNPTELTSLSCFNELGVFRGSSREFRRGAPRMHWNEITCTLAQRRTNIFASPHSRKPPGSDIKHPFYTYVDRDEVQDLLGSSALSRTAVPIPVYRVAHNRVSWKRIVLIPGCYLKS